MNWFDRGEPKQVTELRRLFTTFGYLVAKQGATAAIGLAYWAVVTHLFAARDVGLAAAAASTALLLAAFGGRSGFRSSSWRKSNRSNPPSAASSSPPGWQSPDSWSCSWQWAQWRFPPSSGRV